jgi:hypothetical protein
MSTNEDRDLFCIGISFLEWGQYSTLVKTYYLEIVEKSSSYVYIQETMHHDARVALYPSDL